MLTLHQHNFRLDTITMDLLRELSDFHGMSRSDIVRQAIREKAIRERRIQNNGNGTTLKPKKNTKNLSS